ncbi:cysteinyl leukotriene receptor 2 [Protopterus annectens]|uniref:cysteinyl leukotriene receptor 2 n=1 Tax=Protopterus annectens TaxID=7888 RepID=UPI001CFBC410|nr:cysteinyl leukotriene receptor 2 [Protopterus annectens]XP_043929106.1 cysteinyl leukotriene receptor 2 [Protopterus annectens]
MEDNKSIFNTNCSIDGFKQVVYPAGYTIILVIGLIENGFSCYIFMKSYSQKSSVNVFMLNLVISDLMFIITLPFRIAYFLMQSDWKMGSVLCRIASYTLYVNLYGSIYFLTALSIIRYVAVVHPYKLLKLNSVSSAQWICTGIWIFVLLASSPLLLNGTREVNGRRSCLEPVQKTSEKLMIMNNIVIVVGFIIPFCIICVCYVSVFITLMKANAKKNKMRASSKKAMAMIIITMSIFLICFLPYHILRTIFLIKRNQSMCNKVLHKVLVMTQCLAAANTCFDPLLYYFVGEHFREQIKRRESTRINEN